VITFSLSLADDAANSLTELQQDVSKKRILKDVLKALELMKCNLRHPSLNTHEYHSFKGPAGQKVFESYAQQKTAGAYRIFWCYGPNKSEITILLIIPHP
jgi:hypothetical protein